MQSESAPSSTEESREVPVGEKKYTVSRFRGLKATLILKRSATIARRYPKLAKEVASWEQEYAADNAVTLDRTEAEFRFGAEAEEISDKAWESSGGTLTLKRNPTPLERFAAMAPEILDVAEEPALDLLAIVSLTNRELADADDADGLDELIKARRKEILHDGDVEELIDLAVAGYEVSRGQFGPLVALARPFLGMMGVPTTTEPPEPTEPSTSPEEEAPPTSSTPSETSPPSSTDSEPPTDGHAERSSTPPGPVSEPSPTG